MARGDGLPEQGDLWQGPERQAQADVEKWLESVGYARRSPEGLDAGRPARGWQVHVVRAQGNPLLLDVLLLDLRGRFLELELKTATGTLEPHQRAILEQLGGRAAVCRGLEQVQTVVRVWETEGEQG